MADAAFYKKLEWGSAVDEYNLSAPREEKEAYNRSVAYYQNLRNTNYPEYQRAKETTEYKTVVQQGEKLRAAKEKRDKVARRLGIEIKK